MKEIVKVLHTSNVVLSYLVFKKKLCHSGFSSNNGDLITLNKHPNYVFSNMYFVCGPYVLWEKRFFHIVFYNSFLSLEIIHLSFMHVKMVFVSFLDK